LETNTVIYLGKNYAIIRLNYPYK